MMEERFDVPYVTVPYPFGWRQTVGCRVFGAYKAYSGIEGIVPVIHGPVGCYWSNLFFQLAHDASHLKSATTALHDRDVVYGSDRRLAQAIEAAKRHYSPEVIAILGCCVPALIGDDVDAVRCEEPLPTIHIDAAGFKDREYEGYEDALVALLPFIEKKERQAKTVNLLGLDPISPKVKADLMEIERLLDACGYRVNAALSVGASLEQVRQMAAVEKNIVLGGCGLKLAQAMEAQFGVPFESVTLPYGFHLTREFLRQVNGTDYEEDVMASLKRVHYMLHRFYDMPVAVVGDVARAGALSDFLFNELGCDVRYTGVISGPPEANHGVGDLFSVDEALRDASDDLCLIYGTSFQKRH
jgi:nitrogenase molybdenum-iron protein alpha/beta subunit